VFEVFYVIYISLRTDFFIIIFSEIQLNVYQFFTLIILLSAFLSSDFLKFLSYTKKRLDWNFNWSQNRQKYKSAKIDANTNVTDLHLCDLDILRQIYAEVIKITFMIYIH